MNSWKRLRHDTSTNQFFLSRYFFFLVENNEIGDKENFNDVHAIIEKGITFDTSGFNIKPTYAMEAMYIDKGFLE